MPRNSSIEENIETDSWRIHGFSWKRLFNIGNSIAVRGRRRIDIYKMSILYGSQRSCMIPGVSFTFLKGRFSLYHGFIRITLYRTTGKFLSVIIDRRRMQLALNSFKKSSFYRVVCERRGLYRLLILDGHRSHLTTQFTKFCDKNHIIPLYMPPYSSYLLQPLDIGCFSVLNR
jgi:hypothetical protein